jgi:hypothetical protein
MHEHSWYFTLAPGRWTATCACGLAVVVQEPRPGCYSWDWQLDGAPAPGTVMVAAVASLLEARHTLLTTLLPGRNGHA